MARITVTPYSSNADARTVTLTGLSTVVKEQIVSIRDAKTGTTLYLASDAPRASLSGKTLTLPKGVRITSPELTITYETGGVVEDADKIAITEIAGLEEALAASGGGTGSAVLVIAAANSSDKAKLAADYVCDGVQATGGDEVDINAAIAALPAGGGRIVLAEGQFWRTAPIVCDKSGVTIEGQGFGATFISPANNATGAANVIVGSNSASAGLIDVELRDFQVKDGYGLAVGGTFYSTSKHGIIMRCNNGRIRRVKPTYQALDGIRIEGVKTYGTATTLTSAISTAPAQVTQQTINVTSSTAFTAGGYARLGAVSDLTGDPDYELLYVVSKPNGTSLVVQRGYGGSKIKTHANGATITPMTGAGIFDNILDDVYSIFPGRNGLYVDPWVTDSEFIAVKVDGGDSFAAKRTVNGIYNTGAGNSFVVCHAYFVTNAGFYGNGAGLTTQCTQHIKGGAYENNTAFGVLLEWCKNSDIDAIFYGNDGNNVGLYDTQMTRVTGHGWSSQLLSQHIYVSTSTWIDISGYIASDNTAIGTIVSVNSSTKVRIRGCHFTKVIDASWPRPIYLNDSSYCQVSDNTLEVSVWENGTANNNIVTDNVLTILSPAPSAGGEQPTVHLVGANSVWDNKPVVTTITSSATPTVNTDVSNAVTITALATAITSMTTNLTGTPGNFQKLVYRIKDDGNARAITWGAKFEAGVVALPTTTVAGKVLTVQFHYDTVDAKWACLASGSRA